MTRGREAFFFSFCNFPFFFSFFLLLHNFHKSEPVRPRPRTASHSRHFAALPLALIIYLSAKPELVGRRRRRVTVKLAATLWTSKALRKKLAGVRLFAFGARHGDTRLVRSLMLDCNCENYPSHPGSSDSNQLSYALSYAQVIGIELNAVDGKRDATRRNGGAVDSRNPIRDFDR